MTFICVFSEEMADDGFDFFAPQPKPVSRQKNTMFDVVPDAFSKKTLEFTGDHRRVKRAPEGSTTGISNVKNETPAAGEPQPVEETMKQYVVVEVEAEKWEGVSEFCISELNYIKSCSFTFD
jgi:hypothetical protein